MNKKWIVIASATLVSANLYAAQTVSVQKAEDGDLRATSLRPASIADWQNQRREAVQVTLPIEQESALQLHSSPETIESKSYWREISGAELKNGVQLPISGEEALLQLSPMNGDQNAALDIQQLLVDQRKASDQAVVEFSMQQKQAGDFSPNAGSLQMKLSKAINNRSIELRSQANLKADTRYLVQVVEKNSPFVLRAQHENDTVLSGQNLRSNAALFKDGQRVRISASKATLIAPDGRRIALPNQAQEREQKLNQMMEFPQSDKPGLWEIEWQISANDNGVAIQRNVRNAFSYGNATARWGKAVQIKQDARQWTIDWPVETVSAGRYELRAIAAKRENNGDLTPIALVSSAKWLDNGKQKLALTIDKSVLADNGHHGDIVLLDTRLYDQTRMSLLQRQARTLSLKNVSVPERADR